MLRSFEDMARTNPRRLCFTVVGATGRSAHFTFHQARLLGSALAQCLQKAGVRRDDYVVVDLPNGEAWPLLLLAAAYGLFSLVALDANASREIKHACVDTVAGAYNSRVAYRVDPSNIDALMEEARALIDGSPAGGRGDAGKKLGTHRASLNKGPKQSAYLNTGRDSTKLPPSALRRYATDAEETVVHFADHSAHLFDASRTAVVMFPDGESAKAVPLTWGNITSAAKQTLKMLTRPGRGTWQAALPFSTPEGLQCAVRSFCNSSHFVVYERFDAPAILSGVDKYGATHISLTGALLSRLMATDAAAATLSRYVGILVEQSAITAELAVECRKNGLSVYACYGMIETAGCVALSRVDARYNGLLRLTDGVQARVTDAKTDGYGRLSLAGPSICIKALNTRIRVASDGFLPTNDIALVKDGFIRIREHASDVFISLDGDVFSEDIRGALLQCAGVADAFVFGAEDAAAGMVPVAFVERNASARSLRESSRRFVARIRQVVDASLSPQCRPRYIFPLDTLPRTGSGTVDGALLYKCFTERLQVVRVTIMRVCVPFLEPFVTAYATYKERESLFVLVEDHAGRTGLGECVAAPLRGYGTETIARDEDILKRVLAPRLIGETFLHPGEVSAVLNECPEAVSYPHACAALESSLWDLYGKVVEAPLWKLLGGTPVAVDDNAARVRAGAVVGLCDVPRTVEAVWRCAEAGYGRVNIKIKPGQAYERVRAVRQVFPDLMLTLDANQSFEEHQLDELRALDDLHIGWIEEPLRPRSSAKAYGHAAAGSENLSTARETFARLSQLQDTLRTPLCLDESISTLGQAYMALEHPNLHYLIVKAGRLGGVRPTLDFIRYAQSQGVRIWLGGSYEFGVSRRLHAALQTLSGIEDLGDIGSVLRYFPCDLASPPHTVECGFVTLNRPDAPYGIGCTLDQSSLEKYLVHSTVVS